MKWIDLFEAIWLVGMYDYFKTRAAREGKPFAISKGKFVHDLGAMLDMQLAQQSNGKVKEPAIKYAYR